MGDKMLVSWFSAGISSFVATMLVKPNWRDDGRIIFIDIDDHHEDTARFVDEASSIFEREFGLGIETLKSRLGSVENACLMRGAIKFVKGSPCTDILKRRVRKEWEAGRTEELEYVWGMDYDERDRARRIVDAMPKQKHSFPLIAACMKKADCHGFAAKYGIKRPAMYDLGYNNNNCVGCVKGGMGYWNKIRVDFPAVFDARAKLERRIGASILKECYLDELDPNRGREQKPIIEDCGLFCELAVDAAGRGEGESGRRHTQGNNEMANQASE
jgi:3'-phosphoadenosine 5'-phosphosulfate sulfotransferase (PAPS reductase)/FAD synthetase